MFPRVRLFLLVVAAVFASFSSALAVSAIRKTESILKPGAEYLVFYVTGPVEHQNVFTLEHPSRVVIDLETVNGAGVTFPAHYQGTVLSGVRFGQFDADTARIVVDLKSPVASASLHHFDASAGGSPRLVLELRGGVSPVSREGAYPTPVFKPEHTAREAGKPVIVIDAGHGGKDPGARGKKGSIEKDVTLALARQLSKELLRTGRYRVVLTRDRDVLISLRDRVDIARKTGGDLFISIHADSAPSSDARGLSIYTLSEKASDAESEALAAQENKSDIIAGVDLSHQDDEVAGILIELAQRETRNKSSKLADVTVEELHRQQIRLLPNPHRFAGFRVLKAADIPSILVESAFMSNPYDEKLLGTADYRKKIIRGIIAGIDQYFDLERR